MKKVNVKRVARNAALSTIDGVATPLHMAVILTGNMVKAGTDMVGNGIANAEGYLVNKVDSSRDRVEIAKLRKEHTDAAFVKAGTAMYKQAQNIKSFLANSKTSMKKAVNVINKEVGLINQEEFDDTNILFDISTLKQNRIRVANDTSLSETERNKQFKAITREITKKEMQLNLLPKVSPEQAFGLAPAKA